MGIVLHLAVHLLGVAVAAGLALLVGLRPHRAPAVVPDAARPAILVGALLLVVSHLAVGGLVAPADGWPLLLRAAGYAAVAVGAAGGLASIVPAVALLPGTLPLTAAIAGGAAAAATATGVLGRGRRIALLVAGLVAYAIGDLLIADRPGPAAAASLAGSVLAGTWLLRRAARRSLAGRVTGASLVLLVVAVLGVAAGSGLVLTADVQAEQRQRLTAVATAQAGDVTERSGAALEATASALAGATLVEPLENGDRDLAAQRVSGVTSLPDVDVVVLTDLDGQVVAATRRDGDLSPTATLAIAAAPAVGAARDGVLARGVVDLGDGTLVAIGVAPVSPTGDDGRPLPLRQAGTLVLGRTITAAPTLERIAADTAADAAIVVGDRTVVATDALADLDLAGVDATGTDGSRLIASAPLGEPARGQLVLALPADIAADATATATRSTFLLALVGLLLVGGVATVLGRRIARPVSDLTAAAEAVAAGDLHAEVARPSGQDEVVRLADAFVEMTSSLATRDADLRGSLREQAALRDELEAVTASMGEALLATDAQGRIVTANPAARALLGDGDGDTVLPGRELRSVLAGRAENGTPLAEVLDGASRGAVTVRGELAGSGRIVEISAAPLTAPDGEPGPSGRVHVVRDITDRVMADRVRTEVIANLSHELNTPLTPIKAFLELLAARGGVDPRYEPMLELAREGRQRLERTIGALVDLAELEAGRRVVAEGPVDLREVVSELVARWRARAPEHRVTRRLERGLPEVAGDTELLGRTLDELVDNACKFSSGPVRITARRAERDGQEVVELSVHDRGPGIAPEQRADALELFVQADGSATRSFGGLGIGLPLAHRMVQACGGTLTLHDPPGGGTEVTLTLPAAGTPHAIASAAADTAADTADDAADDAADTADDDADDDADEADTAADEGGQPRPGAEAVASAAAEVTVVDGSPRGVAPRDAASGARHEAEVAGPTGGRS